MSFEFQFKQFGLNHTCSSMKIGTDAILLGALTVVEGVKKILEIGCGCGIISLMLAQRSNAQITALDIHHNSVIQAEDNFKKSPWKERLIAQRVDIRDYFTNSKFDLIVSNPPYFNNSMKPNSENSILSKHTDFLSYGELCKSVCSNLSSKGSFWLILPTQFFNIFSIEASKFKLFCTYRAEIASKIDKTPSLIVSSWSLKNTTTQIVQFYISDLQGNPSANFKYLTSPFYLNF